MSYRPKTMDNNEMEALVSKKLLDVLRSVNKVSAMYIEPGDVVLVKIDTDDDSTIQSASRVMKTLFSDNEVLVIGKGAQIELVKKQLTDKG